MVTNCNYTQFWKRGEHRNGFLNAQPLNSPKREIATTTTTTQQSTFIQIFLIMFVQMVNRQTISFVVDHTKALPEKIEKSHFKVTSFSHLNKNENIENRGQRERKGCNTWVSKSDSKSKRKNRNMAQCYRLKVTATTRQLTDCLKKRNV